MNIISSTTSASNGSGCNKVAVDGLTTVAVQDEAVIMHPKCQANVIQSLATQAKKEASCKNNQASITQRNLGYKQEPTANVAAEIPGHTAKISARQPLGELNGQAQMVPGLNVMQSMNGYQGGKDQKTKAPTQENICPLPSIHVSGEAVGIVDLSLKSSNSCAEVNLLQSQGKLPVKSISVAQISKTFSPQGKRFNLCDGNKENCPPPRFKENTRNSLEINVLEISELIARCAPPSNKYAESSSTKASNSIRSETDGLQF